jgi:hypothetical protein
MSVLSIESHEWPPYITPNEATVDAALVKGDFSNADRYASEVIKRHRRYPEQTLPRDLFHTLVKQIALPSYKRAYGYFYGQQDVFSGPLAAEVSAVYGSTVDLLRKLRRIMTETELSSEEYYDHVGYTSELTVMALICRANRGETDDQYDILPSLRRSDRGTKTRPGQPRDGFDFILIDYETERDKYLQVKTTATPGEQYSDTITMVIASELAGGTHLELRQLQAALIAECRGKETEEQLQRIEQASQRLADVIHS